MSSRHKSKRRESIPQQWSPWTWTEEYQCYVRSRVNNASPGGVEWDYRNPAETTPENDYNNASSESAPDIPRYTPPAHEQLQSERQTSYSPPESYTYQRDDDSVEELSRGFQNTALSDDGSYNDKGKQPAYSNSSWQSDASSPSFSHSQSTLSYQQLQYSQGNSYPSQSYYPTAQRYPQGQLGYIPEDEQTRGGEAFASYDGASYQNTNFQSNFMTNSYSNPGSSQEYGYGYGAASSRSTDPDHIVGNDNLEVLDPDFKIHYSKEFKYMRVFKMVWHETRGENNTFGTDTIYGKFKQPVNASIRRFVIIKADRGHCLCLPILTYNRQGTTKRGLIVQHHGMIYTGKHAPELQPGEQPLSKPSVRMIPKKEKDRLDPASRINYAKIYTVEHNVKCVFIGHIDESHRQRVVEEYNKTLQI